MSVWYVQRWGGAWSLSQSSQAPLSPCLVLNQPSVVIHSYVRLVCAQVGRRLVPVTILAGSVVRVWAPLESVLSRHEGMLSKSDRTMRVVRVDFGNGETLIGAPFIVPYYQQ
jgi:hypothetical protein